MKRKSKDKFLKNLSEDKVKIMKELLVKTADTDVATAMKWQNAFAKALQEPLRQGVLDGDIIGDIFVPERLEAGQTAEYPLSFLTPGTEKDFVAYTMPDVGRIPERQIGGDEVRIPTYAIGNSIDWPLEYARRSRWNVVAAALDVFNAGITKKLNDDGWHTILGAALDRGLLVVDSAAVAGEFTKKLISLVKIAMRRNGGGNSTSIDRGKLTDLYISVEAMEDIRNWGADEVDEVTRRELLFSPEGTVNRIYNVNIHDLDELGEGQEYQVYYDNVLSGTMGTNDVEIGIGLDLSRNDSFVMPISQELEIFEDSALHRAQKAGIYGWTRCGMGVLDNRRTLLLSM